MITYFLEICRHYLHIFTHFTQIQLMFLCQKYHFDFVIGITSYVFIYAY